jgi:hypothetical protein
LEVEVQPALPLLRGIFGFKVIEEVVLHLVTESVKRDFNFPFKLVRAKLVLVQNHGD